MFEFKHCGKDSEIFATGSDPVNPVYVGYFTKLPMVVAITFNRDTEGLIPEKLEGKRFFFDPKTHIVSNEHGGTVTALYYGENFSFLWSLIGIYYAPEV